MAKLERTLSGDFNQLIKKIETGILNGSMSATLEDSSDFYSGDARCSVRVFERYSYAGGNRVSMNVTLFQNGNDEIRLSAITSGGSQAVLFKINTWGEEAFLDVLQGIIQKNDCGMTRNDILRHERLRMTTQEVTFHRTKCCYLHRHSQPFMPFSVYARK